MISSNFIKFSLITGTVFVLFLSPTMSVSFAQGVYDLPNLYKKANDHFMLGEYRQAVEVYDEILEISPENKKTLLMKGIALSNLDRHKSSILEFYNVHQQDSQDATALIGLGVGFGNFGEYKQALTYFEQAYEILPENHIVQNYYEFATKTVEKYPYNEVEKPQVFALNIPQTVPAWIKNTAGWWADGQIPDEEFLKGVNFLIGNGLLIIDIPDIQELTEDEKKVKDRNEWEFSRYLDRIEKEVNQEKRYIEYPNPSNDVIKKFLRDYVKWNYDQQIEIGNKNFPNPEYVLIDDVYHLEYKVYVNEQPIGLPLDHVSTLVNSFKMWEDAEFSANDGKKIKINFVTSKTKTNANLWVTWVVRDLGEGVLGHANLGKGVVEVALGGYGCDGNFQLYHVDTVEYIMTHELGHGIGLKHSNDKNSIMFPSMKNTQYAYCVLDVDKKISTSPIFLGND
ncbi:MAG: matrixin family metalloprotease [Candidatus Nitrosopelagicus sp.]|nr:matrixin family metalloprotease [Candidatus Nitrosopelagicus sp.]